jgi:transcriptional regulator with XRE-family HTH domain
MLGLMMPLKDRLKQLRKAAGLTQQGLAMKAGLSVSAVVQIENGTIPDPRISTLRALAKAMGVTLDQLAGEDDGDQGEAPAEGPEPPAPKKPKGKKK